MSFEVAQKTLERLEWPRILARLADHTRTPAGRVYFAADAASCFEATHAGVRERLAETSEARAIRRAGDRPPLGGASDLATSLTRVRKGGALAPADLLAVCATLVALRTSAGFFATRADTALRLADLASLIEPQPELEREIERCLEPSGELRDSASRALAEARGDSRRLGAEIQARLDQTLRDPGVRARLSDTYYTVRNDRYVLPVRADARGGMRGIVHGASGSGTTLYVEPEALVELNNSLKQSELAIERETRRVLAELSERTAAAADAIEGGVLALGRIDAAFSRAAMADEMEACDPEVGDEGVLRLPQLRHPLLAPEEAVANDLSLGEGFRVLVLSGPNAGGKTVTMKAVALAVLFVRAGLHVPAGPGARVDLFDAVLADIGDEQDIRESLSTFSAHMANLAAIVRRASHRTLIALDEIGVGTDPGEGASLAQAALESLADSGALVMVTTHYNLLKEMAEVDPRFENASVEFDPRTLAPTYRLQMGAAGTSSATAVAARMGLSGAVIERANALLEHEDRRLDRMLAELSASRVALEREQLEASRARVESQAARDEYRTKLERLQERRDKLFHAMRDDLDRAFRDAHAEVAGVIRQLQRGGSAKDAARARERLQHIEQKAQAAQEESGATPAPDPADAPTQLVPIDWKRARAGDAVQIEGGARGVLLALPDRRGRVSVGVGSARMQVPVERVGAAELAERAGRQPPPIAVERAPAPLSDGDAGRCDLRGLRVDEALDRLDAALDRAASADRPRLVVVHGVGTGALADAVRRHLKGSAYVSRVQPGGPTDGGDGVTLVEL